MFLLMQPDGVLAMRLPDVVREEFLKKYKAKLHEAYGAVAEGVCGGAGRDCWGRLAGAGASEVCCGEL